VGRVTATATPQPRPEDPKPAFERIAAAWLAREVDGGHHVDPGELARQVSVTPRLAAAILTALRASRERDPACARVRMLLARDRIQAAFVAAELRDGSRLDPDELARQAGVSVTTARQWLHTLRAARSSDPTLYELRATPAEHRPATPEQLGRLQATYARGGRPHLEQPSSADRALERIEQLYQQEQASGRRLDPAEVARQVGVGRAYVTQTLAALRGGTMTTAQRVEQLWQVVERDGGRHLAAGDVARMLGVGEGRVRQVLGPLRTRQRHHDEQPAPTSRARLPLADHTSGTWLDRAACRDLPPGRFFPETGEQNKAAEAKAVCAGCQVRDQCRDLAVKAANGLDRDHGIFGGTLPAERSRLRGRSFPEPSAYRQRRDLAEEAHELASRVGLRQAARQLGVHRDALTAAWARWGLAQPQAKAGWQPSPFLAHRAAAERAYRLAERLGSVNAAAAELGTTWPTLRKAFGRHGLGMPTPDPEAVRARQAAARAGRPATPELDGAFVGLNRRLVAPLASRARPGELPARVRRAEQEATLGYRVTTELTAENHWPTHTARAWAVGQRAHHARDRAHVGADERRFDRYGSNSERPTTDRDTSDGERDDPGDHARLRVARARERGGAER
jgi:WhiB family transcriptional regulator, redox-sensing transcriptional regulator